ncbi:xylulokinase [Stackebrandtia nassauensis]|uniref:Xylulose kinase n=1 Tax=Stackebrandtia nassauensis (strain DSM 44728 / CIP 108903 / NRRL B-16338 / NBRC 102104 / LLR-40K-21) TaxID=446470 RepID=D3QBP1_STANL|nr:xylulokinase [Stackebrandtia nassauensis]ADD42923.1 xylulokinase [Stackebrandtia nassauensis DSM 44728]
MTLVAGIDSSTRSTKVLLVDAETGQVVDSGTAPHPDGTECPPQVWWDALQQAGGDLIDRAEAVAVSGQQHGLIALDEHGEVIRPALLWNDTRSAPQAARLTGEGGGPGVWAQRTGSVPTASFTVTKLAWLAEHEPDNAERTAAVLLPHDWLTLKLRGVGFAEATTDRSEASGTGYWSPDTGVYLRDTVIGALGHDAVLPRVAAPNEIVGHTPNGVAVAPGTGDNAGAALGLRLESGDVVISLGTSGTVFGVAEAPAADPTGLVAGFADATGRFLPLVCTLNAAGVLDTVRDLLNVDHAGFDALALAAAPGSGGLTLLPYLDGERTPNRPNATGVLSGLTTHTTRADLARAAVEGMLSAQADGLAALSAQGLRAGRVLLIGGASSSEAVRRIAPHVFGLDVEVPPTAEYVALGAARQAAWALSGRPHPPQWNTGAATGFIGRAATSVTEQYSTLRDETASWTSHR